MSKCSRKTQYLSIEYMVTDEATRKRFQTLLVNLMNTIAEVHGRKANNGELVGWDEYVASTDESLALLDSKTPTEPSTGT